MENTKSLKLTGLSMSQAATVSNLCNQRATEIAHKLTNVNNATKTIMYGGQNLIKTAGRKLPVNVQELLLEKALLHSTQAFLMENIKRKEELLQKVRTDEFKTELVAPQKPDFLIPTRIKQVDEEWGWRQLIEAEYNEYLEVEAYAAHIGQFIHKGSTLDKLRKELPSIQELEWEQIEDGRKTPVIVKPHHTSEELLQLHESLALLHRQYEQKVNYYKAKVKNLVTDENARIARVNADESNRVNIHNAMLQETYRAEYDKYLGQLNMENELFEAKREETTRQVAALRIHVDARFKPVIDGFLSKLEEK